MMYRYTSVISRGYPLKGYMLIKQPDVTSKALEYGMNGISSHAD